MELDRGVLFVRAIGLSVLMSCSGAQPSGPPSAPSPIGSADAGPLAPPASASAAEAAAPPDDLVPTECARRSGKICLPPEGFVARLCSKVHATATLALFAKGTPWTRGYLTRKTEAYNASGGVSSGGHLEFDEEVIVLRHRAVPQGGMQISGAGGGYDALRWDGTCATLDQAELTFNLPPQPKNAPVAYRLLEPAFRDALREDPTLDEAVKVHKRECKGVTMGAVSAACEKADKKLAASVVAAVRRGVTLPRLERLP